MSDESLSTVQRIRQRGRLLAGVSKGIFGLSYRAPQDQAWRGFDIELARAVAIAVLGDPDAIEFVPVAPQMRCQTVAQGLVDIGTFNASATLGRETAHNVIFPQAMLYDGEALMVRAADMQGVDAREGVAGLARRIVAVQEGATTTANLLRYFGKRGLSHELRAFATPQEALDAYASGECNVYALDRIPLTGERLRLPDPEEHVILDEQISKEAMGPVVSARDSGWTRAVAWIMRTLIETEELELDSRNCGTESVRSQPDLHAFLHPSQDKLDRLGLVSSFPLRILQHVGTYAEVFERTLGRDSPLKLPRLKNALWSHGGLLISPSFH